MSEGEIKYLNSSEVGDLFRITLGPNVQKVIFDEPEANVQNTYCWNYNPSEDWLMLATRPPYTDTTEHLDDSSDLNKDSSKDRITIPEEVRSLRNIKEEDVLHFVTLSNMDTRDNPSVVVWKQQKLNDAMDVGELIDDEGQAIDPKF